MSVTVNDIKYTKSRAVSDLSSNGGRKSNNVVISGARHALFPRVTKTERTNGVIRHRKEFWNNENSSDEIAYGVLQWLETISNAGDRFYLKEGDQTDVQGSLTTPATGQVPLWTGTGALNTVLSGGEVLVKLDMESDDFVFETGTLLHIADKVKTAQTIGSTVAVGDSVQFIVDTWEKVTSTSSITYPNGAYLGDSKVLTLEPTTKEEWLEIADRVTTDESIGTGNASTNPTLSTLANVAMGVHQAADYLPVISSLDSGDAVLTMYLYPDGTVDPTQGNGVSGELNMADGTWTITPVWDTAPKTSADITCTYRENPFSYSSNECSIFLDTTVSNPYAVANTFAGGCVYADEVTSLIEDWVETSVSGTYDETTYPVTPHNDGAEEDEITITFTSPTTFSVAGTNMGSLGTGFLISAVCEPTNPETGVKLFTLLSAGWGGSWLSGDTIVFSLHPASKAIWLKEVVPALTAQESNNLLVLGYYTE